MQEKEVKSISLVNRLVRLAVLLLVSSGLWLTWMATSFPGLTRMEAFHTAQVSRNLAEGNGFTTSVILPLSLRGAPRIAEHPDLTNPPLFVLWEAMWFAILHPGGKVAALASGTAWWLAVGLLYGFATTLLGRKRAWLAVGLFLLNPAALQASVEGLSAMMTAALVTGCFWLMTAPPKPGTEDDPPARRIPRLAALGAAALAGLVLLCDYDAGWTLVPVVLLFWVRWPAATGVNRPLETSGLVKDKGRFKAWLRQRPAPRLAADLVLAVLVVALPWMARNQFVTGHPLTSLHDYALLTHTETYPGLSVYRYFEDALEGPGTEAVAHGREVWTKGLAGLGAAAGDLAESVNPLILILFGAGCLFPARGRAGRLSRYLLAFTLLLVLRNSFYTQRAEIYTILAPAMTVLSLASLFPRLRRVVPSEEKDRRRRGRLVRAVVRSLRANPRIQVGAFLVLGSALLFFAYRARHPAPPPLKPTDNIQRIYDNTPLQQAVVTVSPWMVAWYSKLPAVWMPETKTSFQNIEDRFGEEIQWLYFPSKRAVMPSDDMPETWLRALQTPEDFGAYKYYPSALENEWLFRKN